MGEMVNRLRVLDERLRSHERVLVLGWFLAWLGMAVVAVLDISGRLPGEPRILGGFAAFMGLLAIPLRKKAARAYVRAWGSLAAGSEGLNEGLTVVAGLGFIVLGLLIWLRP